MFGRRFKVSAIPEEIEPGVFNPGWRSGAMVKALLDGKIKPVIISPDDAIWIEKAVRGWSVSIERRVSDRDLSIMTSDAEDLLRTPLILAMWESRAQALGCWPVSGPDCTWQAIIELTGDPKGWELYGHPEWGRPTVGFAIVGRSNSATFMAMFVCLSGLEDPYNATSDDISVSNGCGQAIDKFQRGDSITVMSNTRILEEMRGQGLGNQRHCCNVRD